MTTNMIHNDVIPNINIPAATAPATKTVSSGPLTGVSSRMVRMTVADLRGQLAELPDWAEIRIGVGFVQVAVWEAEYRRGFLVLAADESDPSLPTATPHACYCDADEEGAKK